MKTHPIDSLFEQLLQGLKVDGKVLPAIYHPLFYTYPYGLRLEVGNPELALSKQWATYVEDSIEKALSIYHSIFAPKDRVLIIIDRTPDKELKAKFSRCQMRRVRTLAYPAFLEDQEEYEPVWFHRYFYLGNSSDIPETLLLRRIVEGEVLGGNHPYFSSCVYCYNVTKGFLFHLYDDRGADLIGFSREFMVEYYHKLNGLLLDFDRKRMDDLYGTQVST